MTFSMKTERYHMDEEDIDGAIRILTDSIYDLDERAEKGEVDEMDGIVSRMTEGAVETLELIKENRKIDTGKRFALLFKRRIEERLIHGD